MRRFAASIMCIHCVRTRTTVEDHGCTGKGWHATRTTTQRYSRPMPLVLLYRAPSFGCSSFFVHRRLCKNRSIDVRGRMQCFFTWIYMDRSYCTLRASSDRFFWRVPYVCVVYVYVYSFCVCIHLVCACVYVCTCMWCKHVCVVCVCVCVCVQSFT